MAVVLKKRSDTRGKISHPPMEDRDGLSEKRKSTDLEELLDELSERYHFLSGLIRECEEIVELNKAGQRKEAVKSLFKTLKKIKADEELRDVFKSYVDSNVGIHLSAVPNMVHVLKTKREAVKHQITLKIQKQVNLDEYRDIAALRDHLNQHIPFPHPYIRFLIDENKERYQKDAKRVVIGSTLFYLGTATGMMMLGASSSVLVALAVGVAIAQYSITSAMYYSMRKQNTKIVKEYVSRAYSTYVEHMEVFDRAIKQYQHHISWVKEQLKIRHIDDLGAVRATATGIFGVADLPLLFRGPKYMPRTYEVQYFTYEDLNVNVDEKKVTLLAELAHLMAILKSDESNLRTALKFLASECDDECKGIYEKQAKEILIRIKPRIDAMWNIRQQLFKYDKNKYKQQDAECGDSNQPACKKAVGYSAP